MLVEEGGASVYVQDRWGKTPLDEARRVGAALVVSYLEQAAVKRREADLARRAEQQRLLSAGPGGPPYSNWRREQQLQQQLRSEEVAELYRLRQVQAQQVRQLSSSILGESAARQFAPPKSPSQQGSAEGSSLTSEQQQGADTKPIQAGSEAGAANVGPGDAVGQLMQLAAQAQQALTLKVEEMELEYVENLQHRKDELQAMQQAAGSSSSSDAPAAVNSGSSGTGKGSSSSVRYGGSSNGSKGAAARPSGTTGAAGQARSSSSGGGSSTSSSGGVGSNNVVSAPKLQQPVRAPTEQ